MIQSFIFRRPAGQYHRLKAVFCGCMPMLASPRSKTFVTHALTLANVENISIRLVVGIRVKLHLYYLVYTEMLGL